MIKSYSHKPHLANLPHDLRTNDVDLLKERKSEIEHRIEETNGTIKDIEKTKSNLQKKLNDIDESIDSSSKNMESSRSEMEKNLSNVSDKLDSIYDNVFLNNGRIDKEIPYRWSNNGFMNEYKKLDDLLYDINWGLGEINDNLLRFYSKTNGIQGETNKVIKNLKEVKKTISLVYNKADSNMKLVSGYDVDMVDSAIEYMGVFKNRSNSYKSSKKINDESVKERDSVVNELSELDKELKTVIRLNGDYVNELDRVNVKLGG